MKRTQELGEYIAYHISGKGYAPRIYKELLKLNK